MAFDVGGTVKVVALGEGFQQVAGAQGTIVYDRGESPHWHRYGVAILGYGTVWLNDEHLDPVNVTVIEGVVERDNLGTVYVAIEDKPYMARRIDYLVAQAIMPLKKYRMTLTIEEVPQ